MQKDKPEDYVELEGVMVHKATIRSALYFRRIDVVASLHPESVPFTSAIRCKKRPNRKPCPGLIRITHFEDDNYEWACSHCTFNGIVYGLKGGITDKSHILAKMNAADIMRLCISEEEYAVLKDVPIATEDAEIVVLGAVFVLDGIELTGCFEDFDDLADYITAEINSTRNRKRKQILKSLCNEIEDMLEA